MTNRARYAGEVEERRREDRPAGPDRGDPGEDRHRARDGDDDSSRALKNDKATTSAGRSRTCGAPRRRSPAPWSPPSTGRPRCSRPAGGGRRPADRRRPSPSPAARSHRPRDGRTSRTGAATAAAGRPPDTSKKCVPNCRSIHSMKKARLTAGTAKQIGDRCGQRAPDQDRHAVDRHARRAAAQKVTMKLAEPTVVETPRNIIPSA